MNNSTQTQKQNRILIIVVAFIAVFASVMILVTAMQGKNRGEEKPPVTVDSGIGENTPSHAHSDDTKLPETKVPEETEKTNVPADTDAAQVNTPENALPDFISPVSGTLSRPYSMDVPVYSLTMEDFRTHGGVDIASELGTTVRASAAGTVTDVWEDPMMGKCVRIAHAGSAVSTYKNLAPEIPDAICPGAAVGVGDVIGTVGESALIELADAPHLHYELTIDGVSVNPADFMLIGTADTAYEG